MTAMSLGAYLGRRTDTTRAPQPAGSRKLIVMPTALEGAYLIHRDPFRDARGSFSRAFCAREFAEAGLETNFVQNNVASSASAGAMRGLHYQRQPHAEVKLVRCLKGAVFDVIVDMRPQSDTYLRWFGAELSEDNGFMLYVPQGFAHGYQALTDGATFFYMVSAFYAPESEAGVRYDDPAIGIRWPLPIADISDKDLKWPAVDGSC